jgi:hypothetical protein
MNVPVADRYNYQVIVTRVAPDEEPLRTAQEQ